LSCLYAVADAPLLAKATPKNLLPQATAHNMPYMQPIAITGQSDKTTLFFLIEQYAKKWRQHIRGYYVPLPHPQPAHCSGSDSGLQLWI